MIEIVAPVLAGVFTPLFATALLAFLGAMAWTDRPIEVEREVLIAFDLLLGVVVGLLLDNTSARDLRAPPGPFDLLQLALYASTARARRDRVTHHRIRLHPQPRRGPRREPPPARASGMIDVPLRALPPLRHGLRRRRAVADILPAGLFRVGRARAHRLPADPRIRPTTHRMGGLTGRANSTRAGRHQPAPGTNPPSTDPSWAAPTPGRGAEGDATSGCARRRRDHPASRSSFPPRTSGRDS